MKTERGKLKCKKLHCKCLNRAKSCGNHHYENPCFEMVVVKPNYIEEVKEELNKLIDVEDSLLQLYALLVFTRGHRTTWEDVHDAWAMWRNTTDRKHRSLVPYDTLSEDVQRLDKEYADAIKYVAEKINPRKVNF